jgi:glycosyltransferase involved in cell wall biosynthesis
MKRQKLYFEATPIVPERGSGIAHALLEMLRELDRDEYVDRYEVIAFVPLGEGKALNRFGFKNIIIKQLPFPHKVLSALTRLPYTPPIDVFLGKGVYIFTNYRNFSLLYSVSITFIYDINYLINPQYTHPKNLLYLQNNMAKWVARSDVFVTSSEQAKAEIVEYLKIDRARIYIVKLGVDPEVFHSRSKAEIQQIREKYALDKDYFLFVGSIEPRKNLAFMINAYTTVSELKNYTLFLVGGDGWLNDDIYKEIDAANEKGFRVMKSSNYVPDEEIPILMSGAAGVLLPSHHEGFGLSIIQANAAGAPVIASDIPVLREVGQDTPYYFKNDNKESFKEAILEAIQRPKRAKKLHYTWQQTIVELEQVVKQVQK